MHLVVSLTCTKGMTSYNFLFFLVVFLASMMLVPQALLVEAVNKPLSVTTPHRIYWPPPPEYQRYSPSVKEVNEPLSVATQLRRQRPPPVSWLPLQNYQKYHPSIEEVNEPLSGTPPPHVYWPPPLPPPTDYRRWCKHAI
ncbi:extensin-like isoform X2 [Lotus japonicus]|uniref:extensin-like isoform X2 n=1 Tax=Lotus japonicus TaxID=34305 RepID=UPI00258DE9B6|nr:extensin-like isoform X2 [Lotus japonicus]